MNLGNSSLYKNMNVTFGLIFCSDGLIVCFGPGFTLTDVEIIGHNHLIKPSTILILRYFDLYFRCNTVIYKK